ncbi:MAG: hypothetical protein NUV32_10465, partial [Exilispira sp.]|nr:hypothetical protein [Exilispira sp.]
DKFINRKLTEEYPVIYIDIGYIPLIKVSFAKEAVYTLLKKLTLMKYDDIFILKKVLISFYTYFLVTRI